MLIFVKKVFAAGLATEDFKIGEKFRTHINDAIRVVDKLVVVLSEQSVKSAWVEEEVKRPLRKNGRTERPYSSLFG